MGVETKQNEPSEVRIPVLGSAEILKSNGGSVRRTSYADPSNPDGRAGFVVTQDLGSPFAPTVYRFLNKPNHFSIALGGNEYNLATASAGVQIDVQGGKVGKVDVGHENAVVSVLEVGSASVTEGILRVRKAAKEVTAMGEKGEIHVNEGAKVLIVNEATNILAKGKEGNEAVVEIVGEGKIEHLTVAGHTTIIAPAGSNISRTYAANLAYFETFITRLTLAGSRRPLSNKVRVLPGIHGEVILNRGWPDDSQELSL